MDRKLAAILAADVVGYSGLMERDEAGTFARLKGLRHSLLEPLVHEHHGRIFKMMGDGFLVEFGSVVDAVACAAALQRGVAERNKSAVASEQILLRVGVNLGDVIMEGDDRHGEGVNIAARLEQLADPGGICVSQPVIDQLSNKLPLVFETIGEHKVKNIEKPVRAYRAKLDGVARTRRAAWPLRMRWAAAALLAVAVLGAAWFIWLGPQQRALPDSKPSIAVLPLDNLSDDKNQGFLADGIAEDLTTELARIPGLFVVSRNAAFGYKGKEIKPVQIASELGVRYILEGSIRRVGDDMRINAQLIDTTTGGHLWAERYDGAWSDIFALQDKIVTEIAKALQLRLIAGQRAAQIAGGTDNPAAYEAFLRGREAWNRGQPEDFPKAAQHYQQAIALDPDFGGAIAELAWLYWSADGVDAREKAMGLAADEAVARSIAYLDAAAKHPSPTYYQLLADQLVWQQKSDEAIVAAERAIALDPSDQFGYQEMGYALTLNGRAADGLGFVDAAVRVDPNWTPSRRYYAGLAYFSLGHFEDAAASLEKIPDAKAADFWTEYVGLIVLTATYGQLGRTADAAAAREKLKPYLTGMNRGELTGLLAMLDLPFKNYADLDRVLDGLREAGVPERPFGFDPKSKDRLTGAEIQALFFGHEFQGREILSGRPYWRANAADGSYEATVGDLSVNGTSRIEGDFLCTSIQIAFRVCRAVFRNPSGTFAQKNEYIYFKHDDRFEFSVVK